MDQISLEEAQSHLAEIIARLSPGAEIVILDDNQPIATIRATQLVAPRKAPRLGTLKGSVEFIAPDFDAIPEGFEEYTE